MGLRQTMTNVATSVAARRAAPTIAARGVRQFLSKAVDGFPGFPGAREVARVTNLGGLVTIFLAIPANLAGLALVQARMAAAIAHLRGYEISDPKVRAAALMTLLGEEGVREALAEHELDLRPHDIAVGAGQLDSVTLERITADVTQSLATRIGGKYATLTIAKRVPLIGGAVSGGFDAFYTYTVGKFADREFPPHVMIERV
jgi:hypothetical protein